MKIKWSFQDLLAIPSLMVKLCRLLCLSSFTTFLHMHIPYKFSLLIELSSVASPREKQQICNSNVKGNSNH